MSEAQQLGQMYLTRSLSILIYEKVKNGDLFLQNMPLRERGRTSIQFTSQFEEFLKRSDVWRRYSPYKETQLTVELMQYYLWRMISNMKVSEECAVLALVYMDRFLDSKRNPVVCTQNVFPIVTAAYIVACKVHEDQPKGLLVELHGNLSFFSLAILKNLERLFLLSVNYRLHIPRNQYVAYLELVETTGTL
eukprot:TRINITY_DN4732_c0_g2_i5.p1 TRINITY_DN4732_c0_g2~~TRINITY_DN4732_c0_g2_i5.p1  ORF type:complete len:192 (-),score=18.94 TRINITY_DN4732_c0_g2_i5:223-798(-)